jgi:hypothetical protein
MIYFMINGRHDSLIIKQQKQLQISKTFHPSEGGMIHEGMICELNLHDQIMGFLYTEAEDQSVPTVFKQMEMGADDILRQLFESPPHNPNIHRIILSSQCLHHIQTPKTPTLNLPATTNCC